MAYRDYCVNFMREVAESELLSRTTLHLGIHIFVCNDTCNVCLLPTFQQFITWTFSWTDIVLQLND